MTEIRRRCEDKKKQVPFQDKSIKQTNLILIFSIVFQQLPAEAVAKSPKSQNNSF
jgi:hypothetical protein